MRFGALLFSVLIAATGIPSVAMPDLFSDNMVLQRDRPCRIWGWATPGERVSVSIAGQDRQTTTPANGAWTIWLDPVSASSGYSMTVEGGNRLEFSNVAFGDVWICSGQSNMEWPLRASQNAEEEITNGTHPRIRLFEAPLISTPNRKANVFGSWTVCDPRTVADFSAVGYFFGRALQRRLDVPIGLIQSAYGGTPAQSWTPWSAMQSHPDLRQIVENFANQTRDFAAARERYERQLTEWRKAAQPYAEPESSERAQLAARSGDLAGWKRCKLPGSFARSLGAELDGVVWFRRQFDLPAQWQGRDLVLELGVIDDYDHTYWNGELAGQTSIETAGAWQVSRSYMIPATRVRRQGNLLAVRVYDTGGNGGFGSTPAEFQVGPADSKERVTLAGDWEYVVFRDRPRPSMADVPPLPNAPFGPGHSHAPGGLFNAMIAPLTPFTVRGFTWYQGESNGREPELYKVLFPQMIQSWRSEFGSDELPFYFVQLAGFDPGYNWAWIREAQTSALSLNSTGMAVALDIGQANDIHPRNKQDVGERLARLALSGEYGLDVVPSGPTYVRFMRQDDEIRLMFDTHGSRLVSNGDLVGFEISGPDGRFHPADARIDGSSVIVSSPSVPGPSAVRYAWSSNPKAALFNSEGLPAAPFRTDLWPRPAW